MISFEEYRDIVSELMDELPDEFFWELSGGVVASEATVIPNYAQGNDLFTLGQYQVFSRVRQITMFKGSFDRAYPQADANEARRILRGVLRHEIRHHLESMGGVHDASSLEAADEREKQTYLSKHADPSLGTSAHPWVLWHFPHECRRTPFIRAAVYGILQARTIRQKEGQRWRSKRKCSRRWRL